MEMLTRRSLLGYTGGALALALTGVSIAQGQSAGPIVITVYKSPT